MIYFFGVEDGKKVVGSILLVINDVFIGFLDFGVKNRMVFVGNLRNVNVEIVKFLNLDVVFIVYWGSEKINEEIESFGILVIVLNFEMVDGYFKGFLIVGKVFGKEEKVEKVILYYCFVVDFVINRILKFKERFRVFFV